MDKIQQTLCDSLLSAFRKCIAKLDLDTQCLIQQEMERSVLDELTQAGFALPQTDGDKFSLEELLGQSGGLGTSEPSVNRAFSPPLTAALNDVFSIPRTSLPLRQQPESIAEPQPKIEKSGLIDSGSSQDTIESSPVGIFRTDAQGKVTFLNERWSHMTGISQEEGLGDGWRRRLHLEDRAACLYTWNDSVEKKTAFSFEARFVAEGAEVTWFLVQLNPMAGHQGGGFVGAMIDITNQKRAEKELQHTQDRFKLFYENAPIPYQSLDVDGNFLEVNPAFSELLGYQPEELIGQWFGVVLTPKYRNLVPKRFPVFKETGRIVKTEFVFLKKDGSEVDVEIDGKIGYHLDGSFKQTHCVLHDVTEHKKAEEQIILEKERAQEANRVKSNFLATMSHELRTPMNGVLGMTQLLKGGSLTDDQQQYCDVIMESGNRLVSILSDILDISKIEADKMVLQQEKFSLISLIDSSVQLFSGSAQAKNIDLFYEVDPRVAECFMGDPHLLGQVLTNLLGNAVKFTPEGSVSLKVQLISGDDDQQQLSIAVEDTGIGVPLEFHDSIFNSFTQVQSESTRNYGGTGLGLSIVGKLLALMNGTVTLDSNLGEGSCFTVWLSLPIDKALGREAVCQTLPKAQPSVTGQLQGRVLLVEDEPINQMVLTKALTSMGLESEVANNGEEALIKLEDGGFQLVLMDLLMPVMDGFEATRYIRSHKDQRISEVPIIAVTAKAMNGDEEYCYESGMNDYLTKPVMLDQLEKVINRWLSLQP